MDASVAVSAQDMVALAVLANKRAQLELAAQLQRQ